MSDNPLTPPGNRPMVTPIVNSVNYEYESFEVIRKIVDCEIEGYTYHRDDNPTVRKVEREVAALEEAEDCVLCTTGMAACSLVYFTYLSAGSHCVLFHDIYGANYKVSLILERMGVDITWLDASCPEKVADAVRPETRLILCETPSNPLLKVLDIGFLREQADRSGALLAVDNTFATPCHQKPLKLGAHLVIHSATKAMGGHNDLMAGAIATCKDYYNELWFTRQAIGTTLDPFSAFLLQRGLKTLPLRAEKMSANALSLAEFLSGHKKVGNVSYPGLPDDPGHALAREQMEGGSGGVLAFDVGETLEDAQNFVNGLEHIYHAVSLGATESLVCVPYLSTMLYLPPERRLSFGVRKNTVRLSAGIENADLLKKDLEQALARI